MSVAAPDHGAVHGRPGALAGVVAGGVRKTEMWRVGWIRAHTNYTSMGASTLLPRYLTEFRAVILGTRGIRMLQHPPFSAVPSVWAFLGR